jgi:PKD repeat protein
MSGAMAENVLKVEREFGPSFAGFAQNKFIVVVNEGTPQINVSQRAGLAVTGNREADRIGERYGVSSFARQFPGARTDKSAKPTEQVLTRYYKIFFDSGDLDQVMDEYRKLPFVEKVEPIAMHYVSATPNDGYYDDPPPEFPYDQWHYWDTYGIEADLGWDDETGSSDVVCAVIDGGVRYYHYDLGGTDPPGPDDNVTNGNIWVNQGEIPANGVDDDNNGYVDDVIGWDFVLSASTGGSTRCTDSDCSGVDNDPSDFGGHGTHVAGTIAAITNNDPTFGVAGVAGGWNDGTTSGIANGVKIMCLRAGYMTRRGGIMHMDYCAEAMFYIATMVDKGVNVAAVNCSWGSSSYGAMPAATDNLLAHDVMIIVACGNDGTTNYDYLGGREDCLDVGATDQTGYAASFSTYGTWVDIAAPGVDILSTYHNSDDPSGDYISTMSGTSMSCPHVVGVAGLLESKDPSLTGPEKFDIMVNNSTPYLGTKYVGTGIVSAKKALDAVGPNENPPVAAFSGTPTSGYAPLNVNFTDLSANNPTNWSWDFGDGVGTSTQQNPSYTYNSTGTYTVTLIATNAFGSDDEVKVNYIDVQTEPEYPPVADFSGTPTSGGTPLVVSFTDLSTENPTSWSWTFGDGVGTSTAQNPSYTYETAGTYSVSLTATNAYGSDSETKVDYINVTEQSFDMHVHDIVVTRKNAGPNCSGIGTIYIYDAGDQAVANATVYATATGPVGGGFSGLTGTDGSVRFETGKTRDCAGEWCFEVTNVTHTSLTYDPSANVVTMACESGVVYKTVANAISGITMWNTPNPFNPTTTISFNLPQSERVNLAIYNVMGQKMATLLDRQLNVGEHSVEWNGSNAPSGVYFYVLDIGTATMTQKMLLLK